MLLLAALFFLWQFRFERVATLPTIRLADLRRGSTLPLGAVWAGTADQPKLRLSVQPGNPPVVLKLALSQFVAMDYLHVCYQASARNLKPGAQTWDDGRGIIEWLPRKVEGTVENDPIFSLNGNDSSGFIEQVMRPEDSPATPVLRFENLGSSGDFDVSQLEVTGLKERRVWKIGRLLLMAGCFAWAVSWCGLRGKFGFLRAAAAASVWLIMLLYFVVPGPWKSLHPLGAPFQIGQEIIIPHLDAEIATGPSVSPAPPPVVASAGKIPDKGDFTLWFKVHVAKARPLLHILLLFGPSFLIALLVGRGPAASLGVILSIAIEAAQFSFGYGFDRIDVFDLICDAGGIALGIYLAYHPLLRKRFRCSSEKPCRSVPVEWK